MNVGLKGSVDSTGGYFVNLISRNRRNEVQFYPVKNWAIDGPITDIDSVKVELHPDEEVVDVVWINNYHEASRSRGKKRSGDSEVIDNENGTQVVLAVLISSGDIVIFSPLRDKPINRIASETKYQSLTWSLHDSTIWAVHGNSLHQICLNTNKTLKSIQLDHDISIAQTVEFKSKNKSKKSSFMVVGDDLQLIDTSRTKHEVLAFPQPQPQPGTITKIIQSHNNKNKFYVGRKDSNIVSIHDMTDANAVTMLVGSEVQDIVDFQIVSNETQELLMAITEQGVQVFNIDLHLDHADQAPCGVIKTTFHEQGVLFSNIFTINNVIIGVWYDGNTPKFCKIDWNFESVGELQVPIDYVVKNNVNSSTQDDLISMPQSAGIVNLSSQVLYKQLYKLLTGGSLDKQKVVDLCVSNDDPTNIKETVKLFFESDASTVLSNNLFEIISQEVASDPTKKSSLSIWLKWLLLAHGGSIAKQPEQYENLQNLNQKLTNGMKVLPHLVALQGRLQLLKSQGTLRSQIVDDDSDEEPETPGESKTAESTIIFASGENDEDVPEEEDILVDGEDEDEDN
jgi:U3 small nucleolar RNA-associated protein 9